MSQNRIHNLHYEKFADGSVKCIEDEIPFELPEGWCWSRANCVIDVRDGTHDTPVYVENGVPLITSKNLTSTGVDYSNVNYISFEDATQINQRSGVDVGDILFAMIGTIGNPKLITEATLISIKNVALFKFTYSCDLNHMYILRVFEYLQDEMKANPSGGLQPFVSLNRLRMTFLPIAPIAEQNRIVKKLDELLSKADIINYDCDELDTLLKSVKSKILDLAIRGQLVPQDPDDEPASVLLERIRAEKKELIKQGKIKRDKKESIIFRGEDNSYYLNNGHKTADIRDSIPFDIPDSWCWACIKDIFIINPRNKIEDTLDVSFIPMPLIDDGYSGKHTFEVRQWKEIKTGFTHFAEGDIGIAKITPCFENRKSAILKNLTNGYGAGTTELHILRPYKDTILAQYVLAYVKSNYFVDNGKNTFSGAVGQQRISKEYVENAYFPIPPIEEQNRIVQQISILFGYLDVISVALS